MAANRLLPAGHFAGGIRTHREAATFARRTPEAENDVYIDVMGITGS